MWRDEIGVVEMLFAYIAQYEEFKDWSSWRDVIVEILSCHEQMKRRNAFPDIGAENNGSSQDYQREDIMKEEVNKGDNEFIECPPVPIQLNKFDWKDNTGALYNEYLSSAWPDAKEHYEDLTVSDDDVKVETVKEEVLNQVELEQTKRMSNSADEMATRVTEDQTEPSMTLANSGWYFGQPSMTQGESSAIMDTMVTPKRYLTLERRHLCTVCKKSFFTVRDLARHIRSHTGERPFPCEVCGKSFSRSDHLLNHVRTHTGERPHSCDVCGKSFIQSGSLKNHLKTHDSDRIFQCNICGETFSKNAHLVVHSQIHIT